MKRIGLILLSTLAWSCTAPTEASFFVAGSCKDCSALIEVASESVPGVDFVDWSIETSSVTVHFDGTDAQMTAIQAAIAAAGFDTQYFPADAAKQETLPECCRQSKSSLSVPGGEHSSPH